jgi:hypothetical protein
MLLSGLPHDGSQASVAQVYHQHHVLVPGEDTFGLAPLKIIRHVGYSFNARCNDLGRRQSEYRVVRLQTI